MNARHYVLDDNDEPVPATTPMVVSLWKAANWSRCVVGVDDIGSYTDGFLVSTVFVGHDLIPGPGPPLLWETRVASLRGQHITRHSSRQDAEKGHAEAVAWAVAQVARRGGVC